MEPARQAAARFAAAGRIEVTQKGEAVEPEAARGPVRLRLRSEAQKEQDEAVLLGRDRRTERRRPGVRRGVDGARVRTTHRAAAPHEYDELEEDDAAHMRKVVGHVHRHLAQRPGDVSRRPWRYSLENWGHDPLQG